MLISVSRYMKLGGSGIHRKRKQLVFPNVRSLSTFLIMSSSCHLAA